MALKHKTSMQEAGGSESEETSLPLSSANYGSTMREKLILQKVHLETYLQVALSSFKRKQDGRAVGHFLKTALVYMLSCIAMVGLVIVGSAKGTVAMKTFTTQKVYNNGTHNFLPTVILISLDGVVNHDLDLFLTPTLSQLADDGVRARWMTPSFPPITFPNHWSLVTGLYPETHGIIANYFWDPVLNETFNYKDPSSSWDSKWWGGEPIWITAVRQSKRSGVIMWPGCSAEINGQRPTLSVAYNDDTTFDEKVDQALAWIDLPIEERPQFIGLYVPQIDQAGHRYGPYASATLKQLQIADDSIRRLVTGLDERNLSDIVHLVVVSDHGMSATDKSRLVYYDDELTPSELALIDRIEADPLLAIWPKDAPNASDADKAANLDALYQAFLRLAEKQPRFKVYRRDMIPERFHFQENHRIPPLLVLPDAGWNLITRDKFDPSHDTIYHPRGTHGYDNLDPQSRAIFVARGPHFHQQKGTVYAPFANVELYALLADILELEPAPNNGTLSGILVPERQ